MGSGLIMTHQERINQLLAVSNRRLEREKYLAKLERAVNSKVNEEGPTDHTLHALGRLIRQALNATQYGTAYSTLEFAKAFDQEIQLENA